MSPARIHYQPPTFGGPIQETKAGHPVQKEQDHLQTWLVILN